ncbi:uncharacterized protein LOC131176305 [Hevea brasiliensis]|uniref:uncharacterized protein LOC131176305 n=1 Tax=Hevea brasiliensis TaxID=3981 RepID=UPI0025E98911|nr:uncharacterized protein LOC131176305 [Hevea brasiliensis]
MICAGCTILDTITHHLYASSCSSDRAHCNYYSGVHCNCCNTLSVLSSQYFAATGSSFLLPLKLTAPYFRSLSSGDQCTSCSCGGGGGCTGGGGGGCGYRGGGGCG